MDYNWREDVVDVIDNLDIPNDTKDDLLYRAAERIVEDNGLDYYDCDESDAIMEEMGNIIGLWSIPKGSALYGILVEWYGSKDAMSESVRDFFEDNDSIYFVTGMNYGIFDKDLLGGNGNGETIRQFEDFVREQDWADYE